MKTNKVIGIPGYLMIGRASNHFGAGTNHLEFISKFGNARVIMPWEEFVEVDMLYLPGGADTSPANYGETPLYMTGNHDVHKEFFFRERLDKYIEAGVPIFGVCLGSQMLAAKFGGKLTQNLIYHEQSADRWKTAHKIKAHESVPKDKGKAIHGLWAYDMNKYEVNSHHHQALTISGLSDQIEPIFVAVNNDDFFTEEGDIVEAFKIAGRPIYGVQWHPEENYDSFAINVVKALLGIPPKTEIKK